MRTNLRNRTKLIALLLVVAAIFSPAIGLGKALAAAPAALPATPCFADVGGITCNLWAGAGTLALPGASVPVWGYSSTSGGPVEVPGPVLIVNQGDVVTVNLTNNLAVTTALLFQGQDMIPDTSGVAPGASKAYTFTASRPGTYLYEAGLIANGQYQVAMGMVGALVVRPSAAGQAYDSPDTAFNDEALVLLSEVDPALNNSANPAAFDMRNYKPRYWLINGKAYPDTAQIPATAGSALLLRYINAGIQPHSMALLGLEQRLIAVDGSPSTYVHRSVAETLSPGQTLDVLVNIPPATADGSRFPLYDGNLILNNNNQAGFGGMMTLIAVGTTPVITLDTIGPAVSGLTLTPAISSGGDITLNASVSDAAWGNNNVATAEFTIDSTAAAPTTLTAVDGTFDSPTEAVTGTVPVGALAAGQHTVYVRGQDSIGNWGPYNSAVFTLDTVGPTVSGVILTPRVTNGSVNVALSATANDSQSGGGNIAAAEYSIDGGAALPMNLNTTGSPIASLTASIPAGTVAGLGEGPHMVSVRAQDSRGNWGAFGTGALTLDLTGPSTGSLVAQPNPNNGQFPYSVNNPSMRVTAAFTDGAAKISTAEGFIDAVGANGTGFPFVPVDGLFNSPSEAGYVNIPLTTINLLTSGNHTLSVHAKDSAGNWGAFSAITLVIDRGAPAISGASASPNPTNTAASDNTSFTLSANVTDAVSNINRAEWFEGADPGLGNGVPIVIPTPATSLTLSATVDFVARNWSAGTHTLFIRARDAAGNWSPTISTTVNVVLPNAVFSDGFESGSFSAWNSVTGTNIAVNAASALSGGFGMQATLGGTAARYVTNLAPVADASYHARFYFNPHGALPANNNSATGMTIFSGHDTAGTAIFQVQFRRQNGGGGTYQVRLSVLRAGGTTNTNWFNISNAAHSIEIAWQSAGSASASLYTDGVLRQTLNNLNTSANLLDSVRLGPSAGLVNGASGTLYFDAFVSTRRTVIGP